MLAKFKVGEKVRITFDGEIEEVSKWSEDRIRYKISDGNNSVYCYEDRLETKLEGIQGIQGGCCARD